MIFISNVIIDELTMMVGTFTTFITNRAMNCGS